MREALRCDIRNGRRMKALEEGGENGVTAAGSTRKELTDAMQQSTAEHTLRNHRALLDLLTDLANPPPADADAARGNWGRWNFDGYGPEAPPPKLKVGKIGAVMSLPGCADQTIHADTPHLYTHVGQPWAHMPPAYFNLFVSSVAANELSGSLLVGQTAFVLGEFFYLALPFRPLVTTALTCPIPLFTNI